jgi:hypothetical protein
MVYQGLKSPLDYQYTLKKWRAGGKISLFQGGYQLEEGGHKERGNKGEYGGYTSYPYIKIEE